MKKSLYLLCITLMFLSPMRAQKEVPVLYPEYKCLVMCGYQGWFRASGDESQQGWVHFGTHGKFDTTHVHIDLWPDVSEYEKTYQCGFRDREGKPARVFSSADKSTTDLHFRWMKEYGIDGVFMQRFFDYTRNAETRRLPDLILKNAKEASEKQGRAIAVMYDLSGLNPGHDDCQTIIDDWKHLVNDLDILHGKEINTYL